MAEFKFSPEGRTAFRKAIIDHDGWRAWRIANDRDAANLSVADMLDAATALGIDPATYGTAKIGIPGARDSGLVKDFSDLSGLHCEKVTADADLAQRNLDFGFFTYNEIRRTCLNKQDGRATQRQFNVMESIVKRAQAKIRAFDSGDIEAKPFRPLKPSTSETKGLDTMVDDAKTAAIEAKLKAMRELLGSDDSGISEDRVIELIKIHAAKPSHVTIDLRTPGEVKPLGDKLIHYALPLLLAAVKANVNVMLVGPAGSGKTSAAAQVADMLELPFYFTGALDSPYKLTGFIDAQGRVVDTAFRKAFVGGGVFLYDEIDASAPGAVLPFNAALANDFFDFPDGTFPRHKDFRAIAAANTFGRGSDRQYVGRLQQDAAVLDRFAVLSWEYDGALEAAMLGAERPAGSPEVIKVKPILESEAATREAHRWLARVQTVRSKVFDQKIRHVVSPRASVMGARLLAAGWPWARVEEAVLFKGLDADSVAKIK